MATTYYRIHPHIHQLTDSTCWYACLEMVVHYHQTAGLDRGHLTEPRHVPEIQNRYLEGGFPTPCELREWTALCGLEPLDESPNFARIREILVLRGPFLYAGIYAGQGYNGHAIVIAGTRTPRDVLLIHDPLQTNGPTAETYSHLMGRLPQTLPENALFVH